MGFFYMKKSKLELMITAHVYIWPEGGGVVYFLSKLAPKEQIADSIRTREATADTAMMKMG